MEADEAIRAEIAMIDSRLKQWFLFRRVQAEVVHFLTVSNVWQRALSIKKLLDDNNFVGLSCNNKDIADTDKVLWNDIVKGRPELEDSLSINAREMKADMYMDIFTNSCDLDHQCRLPGSKYFQCLQNNFNIDRKTRLERCDGAFNLFDTCRKNLQMQQASNLQDALMRQRVQDDMAKKLFDKRLDLMSRLRNDY